jgi:hypothetical protein
MTACNQHFATHVCRDGISPTHDSHPSQPCQDALDCPGVEGQLYPGSPQFRCTTVHRLRPSGEDAVPNLARSCSPEPKPGSTQREGCLPRRSAPFTQDSAVELGVLPSWRLSVGLHPTAGSTATTLSGSSRLDSPRAAYIALKTQGGTR